MHRWLGAMLMVVGLGTTAFLGSSQVPAAPTHRAADPAGPWSSESVSVGPPFKRPPGLHLTRDLASAVHAPRGHTGLVLALAAGLVGAAAVSSVVAVRLRRGRGGALDEMVEDPVYGSGVEDGVQAQVTRALEETRATLRAEDLEPRRAVVEAYAVMERAVEGDGAREARNRSPLETMSRLGRELPACRAAVRRLTEVFLRARFSSHDITGVDRQAALDCLDVILAEVHADAAADQRTTVTGGSR